MYFSHLLEEFIINISKMNFKEIHIGDLIKKRATESGIETSRICNFFKCNEQEVEEMYTCKSIDTEKLLKWSKLLDYDFFRFYVQHLIFYAPSSSFSYQDPEKVNNKNTSLPQFRKNIYTKEIINFVLE